MNKNKKTFADLARALKNKYSRSSFDPIEAEELEEEMTKLQIRQEQFRAAMGMGNPQEMGCGGKMKYDNGGSFISFDDAQKNHISNLLNPKLSLANWGVNPDNDENYTHKMYNRFDEKFEPLTAPAVSYLSHVVPKDWYFPTYSPTVLTKPQSSIKELNNFNKPTKLQTIFTPKISAIPTKDDINMTFNKELPKLESFKNQNLSKLNSNNFNLNGMLPYAISGLSNIAGNLVMANMNKNVPQISPAITTPQKINLEPKANQLRQQADVSKNINMMNARNLGLNPGATLANLGVINAGVDRGLSDNLTNLYMGQEQANVGAENQFALQNQDATNRANMFNTQMKYQSQQDRINNIGQIFNVPPMIMRELNQAKSDKEMRDILDRYYKSIGRNYQTMGSLYDSGAFTQKVR